MLGIVSLIISGVSRWFTNKQEISAAKQQTELAIEQNKQRLALSTETHNHEWEMASLSKSDTFIRRFSFFMFSAPFLVALFSPHSVEVYFSQSIGSIPPFWQHMWLAINGSIWGISSLKNSLTAVISAFRSK